MNAYVLWMAAILALLANSLVQSWLNTQRDIERMRLLSITPAMAQSYAEAAARCSLRLFLRDSPAGSIYEYEPVADLGKGTLALYWHSPANQRPDTPVAVGSLKDGCRKER